MKRIGLLWAVILCAAMLPQGDVLRAQESTSMEVDSTWHIILSQELYRPCSDYSYNATLLIPKWRAQRKFAFINEALDFLDAVCKDRVDFLRTRLLIGMQSGAFSEKHYDDSVFFALPFRFKFDRPRGSGPTTRWTTRWESYDSTWHKYDSIFAAYETTFIRLADSLLPHTKAGSAERLWCYIYTNDTAGFREAMELESTRNTKIGRSAHSYFAAKEAEQRRRDSLKSDLQMTVTAKFGNWVPTGDLKAVGTRQYFESEINGYLGRYLFELQLGIAWQDASTLLQIEHEGQIDSTEQFSTIHFSLNSGYRLLDLGPLTTYAVGGIGIVSVTLIETSNSDYVDKKYTQSFMMGIGLRQLIGAKRHRGIFGQIDLRYNMMWLDNDGGSSVDGNVLTITAGLGYHFWN